MIINLKDKLYVYRNSTGFKPLFIGEDKTEQFSIAISENYVENFFYSLKIKGNESWSIN